MSGFKILSSRKDPFVDVLGGQAYLLSFNRNQLKRIAPEIAARERANIADDAIHWARRFPEANLRWLDFYSERSGRPDARYVPDDVYYAYVDPMLNWPRRAQVMDDKLYYELYFPEVRQPETILRIAGGRTLSPDWEALEFTEALERCARSEEIVLKQTRNSCGGASVTFCEGAKAKAPLERACALDEDFIVQRSFVQHEFFRALNPSSLNTLRLLTLLRANGEFVALSAVMRVGGPGMRVDNVSSGGCALGVTPDGRLKSRGFSHDGLETRALPSGEPIPAGASIPGYGALIECAKRMHRKFRGFRLIGWDLTLSPQGEPVLIEMNLNNAEIDFMQLNNGPLFGEYTQEVVDEVCRDWNF